MWKKPTVSMLRSLTKEVYGGDQLIGYVEYQADYPRYRFLDTYDVIIIDDVTPDESNLSYDPRPNNL